MRNAALLVAVCALTACSLDHIVVAALDDVNAGGTAGADAGRSNPGGGGTAGAASPAGSGGAIAGGSQITGAAGRDFFGFGGVDGTTIIGSTIAEAGGSSVVRCSCLSRQAQACGTDGITYPTDCDAGNCSPPAIACLHACPCLDGSGGSADTTSFTWVPAECVSMARCTDGVVCMTFTDGTFDDTQTTCPTSN